MDRELINQKIESLRRCVERVRQKCPATPAVLASDPDIQDILTLNLTRAIQLCVDIGAHLIATADTAVPGTMGQTFDLLADMGAISAELALRMKKAVGFRNIAVHNYEAIDWQIAHLIATRHMQDFTAFATAIVASIQSRPTA
jgi:uncharacterized protein YutE (UPF0331/DUF86 family)